LKVKAFALNALIFGVSFHLLLKVLPDNGISLAGLKHVRVKDFVVQLLPRRKGPFGIGVDNIVLQVVAAKAVLDTDMKGIGQMGFPVHVSGWARFSLMCIPAMAIAFFRMSLKDGYTASLSTSEVLVMQNAPITILRPLLCTDSSCFPIP
jgi:hypothetical protein